MSTCVMLNKAERVRVYQLVGGRKGKIQDCHEMSNNPIQLSQEEEEEGDEGEDEEGDVKEEEKNSYLKISLIPCMAEIQARI